MSQEMELKGSIEELHKAFHAFKDLNDQNLKKYDGVLNDAVEGLNSKLSEMEAKTEKLHAAIQRSAQADVEAKQGDVLKEAEFKAVENLMRHKSSADRVGLERFLMKELEEKALQVQVDADGGYLVMPAFGGVLNGRIFESSPVRQYASVTTISTDRIEFVIDDDEAGAGWVAETGARTTTDTPQLRKIELPVHELYANAKATQKMLDDAAVNVESWLIGKLADKFARLEATAFVTGDGVGKPRGFLTYSAWSSAGVYEFNKIEQVNSGGASTLTADGLIALVYALKPEYTGNAAFMMSRGSMEAVRKFKGGTTNEYIWQPTIQAGQPSTLLGYPVVQAQDMPAIAASALPVAFGDFRRSYQIVDRIGFNLLRDPFSSKPYVEFYATKRVGGAVVNFDAIKIQKVSS